MSCLFISLGKLLNIDPATLRNQICDYIISNPDAEWDGTKLSEWIQMVAGDRYQNVSQYISEMRRQSQWGGAPEIAVCCMIYNVAVEIVNLRRSASQNMVFKNTKKQQINPDKSWTQYEQSLHKEYPGLTRMKYFHNNHPLRVNYENFMKYKKQDYLENLKKTIDNSEPSAVLTISWTGAHYEPVSIKNHHRQ